MQTFRTGDPYECWLKMGSLTCVGRDVRGSSIAEAIHDDPHADNTMPMQADGRLKHD